MDPNMYETSDDIDSHTLIVLHTLHEEIPASSWRIFRIIHIILTVCSLIGNCVLLLVAYSLVNRLTPPIQLVTNLCFANMLAAWSVVTMYFPHTSCQEEIQTALLMTAHNACALTLVSYVIAYYVAIFKPLEYSVIVSRRRVWIAIAVIWAVALLCAHSHFFITLVIHKPGTLYCYQVFYNTCIALILCIAVAGILLLIAAFVITRTMLYLRPIMAFVDPNQTQVEPRKSTYETTTIILVIVLYLVTWIPYLITAFAHIDVHNTDEGYETAIAMFSCMSFVLLNCVAFPIIFGVRLESLLIGYERLYLKIRQWSSDTCTRLSNRLKREEQATSPLNPIESVF